MRLLKLLSRLIDGTPNRRPAQSPETVFIDLIASQHALPFHLAPPISRR